LLNLFLGVKTKHFRTCLRVPREETSLRKKCGSNMLTSLTSALTKRANWRFVTRGVKGLTQPNGGARERTLMRARFVVLFVVCVHFTIDIVTAECIAARHSTMA